MVLDELPRHWPNLIAGTVYYIGPSVVGIAVAGTFISWRAAVRVTLGTMMCAAILLTAWDLGRFLSWAATVAFIQTSLEMRDCPLTGKVRRGFAQALTIIVLLALAAFFALSPLLDCFFNGCFVIGAEQQLVLRSLAEWHKDLAMQFKRP
jgi:hypothetical protein